MCKYPRGSEWRRWDLHIHTPESVLCQNYNCQFDEYAKILIEKAISENISVIGITDYFCIDGYKKMRSIISGEGNTGTVLDKSIVEQAKNICFLPNIEFRIDVLVNSSRINYHVIFSEDVAVEDIEENFLNRLEFVESGQPDGPDNVKSLTTRNLELLGQRLKREHAKFRDQDDIFVGMNCASIKPESLKKALSNHIFDHKYAIAIPADEDLSTLSWDSQAHQVRKSLIQGAHLVFSGSPNTILWCLGKKGYEHEEDFRKEFKSFKPCIHGSDAHEFDKIFKPDENRFTWIKADPCFQGLLQVLNEPRNRVHIGEAPESLTRTKKKPHQYIDRIRIDKTSESTTDAEWFSKIDIPLNSGLVSIIGNKGSGKSALADIIALTGDTDKHESFAFLNTDKFRNKKSGKAASFEASIVWLSGDESPAINLNSNPDASKLPSVKYIPQNFLETTCNENIGAAKFTKELENVIFTHIPDESRLGFDSLRSLLDYLGKEVESSISHFKNQVYEVNKKIVEFESISSQQNLDYLKSKIRSKCEDLKAHANSKPAYVEPPKSSEESQKECSEIELQLQKMNKEKAGLETDVARRKELLKSINQKIAVAQKIKQRIENYKQYHDDFKEEYGQDFKLLNVGIDDIVKVDFKLDTIEGIISLEVENKNTVENDLDADRKDSLANKHSSVNARINMLEKKLSEPELRYRAYQKELEQWEKERKAIIGSKLTTETIRNFAARLKESKSAPNKINVFKAKRRELFGEILKQKNQLKSKYAEYYKPVQNFIDEHSLTKSQNFDLKFQVEIAEHGFVDSFLGYINQGRVGSYQGVEEGRKYLEDLISSTDFNNSESVLSFADCICDSLYKDTRGTPSSETDPLSQLKKNSSLEDVLSYVYSGDYLTPNYHLEWEGKPIDQLSPGEKGNLLLVFYLLIDQGSSPLILDQPEDNLDNQTVYRTLVPCIRDAAQRRQILMVTHNPNLAVVCDSDQVIVASMDKPGNYCIGYVSGAIEALEINKAIVNILEGTRPAFDQRDAKYLRIDAS